MELIESIEHINNRLLSEFGREFDGQPRWRVVFADDQFEKRFTSFTDDGFELLVPEVRELPKYKQNLDFRGKYILERLIPIIGETDLVTKISYEAAWVFRDDNGNYLPPRFDACKFVIEAIYSQIDKAGMHTRYKDPDVSPEYRQQKLKQVEDILFGDETPVGDALAYGYGVTVPGRTANSEEEAKEEGEKK